MVCTYCGGKTRVVNSRHQKKSNQVWRRRQCVICQATFTSEEAAQYGSVWTIRSESSLQPFSRDKLFLSLYKSCGHRKNALDDAKGLTDTIISKLPTYLVDGTLASHDIVRVAQVALNRFDKAASAHYQAYHSR